MYLGFLLYWFVCIICFMKLFYIIYIYLYHIFFVLVPLNGCFKSVMAFFKNITKEFLLFQPIIKFISFDMLNKKVWFYSKILIWFMLFRLHLRRKKKNKQVYLSFSLEVTVGIKLKSKRCTVLTIFLIGPVISAANISSFFSIDLDNCSH